MHNFGSKQSVYVLWGIGKQRTSTIYGNLNEKL